MLFIDPPGQRTNVPEGAAEVREKAGVSVAAPIVEVDRPEYIYVRRNARFRAVIKTRGHFAAEMIHSLDNL